MVITPRSGNASIVCWRERKGVIEVLVLDSTPTAPGYGSETQVKFPGGGENMGETPEAAARREFQEETGLYVKKNATLSLIHSEAKSRHHKTGFLIERSECKGKLLKGEKPEDDSKISHRRFVPIDAALRIVHRRQGNLTQYELALKAKREIEEILRNRTP